MPRIPATHTKIPKKINNATAPLTIPTYEESGQTVHPDIIYVKEGFLGFKYWMVNTPYPDNNDDIENPCIWQSNDGETWVVPTGTTNPIVPAPTNPAFYSDPCLVLNPQEGKLYVYYRYAADTTTAAGEIRLTTSTDAITWTSPVTVDSHETRHLSPQVHYENGVYWMWLVRHGGCGSNFTSLIKKTSIDGVTWVDVGNVGFNLPSGHEPWHINIKRYNGLFHGVLCGFPSVCTDLQKLFFIRSTDYAGNSFIVSRGPALGVGGAGTWDSWTLYQSCLLNIEGQWKLWYTGREEDGGNFTNNLGLLTL